VLAGVSTGFREDPTFCSAAVAGALTPGRSLVAIRQFDVPDVHRRDLLPKCMRLGKNLRMHLNYRVSADSNGAIQPALADFRAAAS
jgi:hypothetical protein